MKVCKLFTNQFVEFVNLSTPHKDVIIRLNDKLWYDSEICRYFRKSDRLKTKAVRSWLQSDWANYRYVRNKVNNLKRNAKETFYINLEFSVLTNFSSNKKRILDRAIPAHNRPVSLLSNFGKKIKNESFLNICTTIYLVTICCLSTILVFDLVILLLFNLSIYFIIFANPLTWNNIHVLFTVTYQRPSTRYGITVSLNFDKKELRANSLHGFLIIYPQENRELRYIQLLLPSY